MSNDTATPDPDHEDEPVRGPRLTRGGERYGDQMVPDDVTGEPVPGPPVDRGGDLYGEEE